MDNTSFPTFIASVVLAPSLKPLAVPAGATSTRTSHKTRNPISTSGKRTPCLTRKATKTSIHCKSILLCRITHYRKLILLVRSAMRAPLRYCDSPLSQKRDLRLRPYCTKCHLRIHQRPVVGGRVSDPYHRASREAASPPSITAH